MKKLLALFMALMMLTACGRVDNAEDNPADAGKQERLEQPGENPDKQPEPEPEPENTVLTFTAVGDNLIHNSLSIDSRVEGGYDFSPIYAGVADYIRGSDIAFINQEVPLDGTEGAYPTLSAPHEVASALTGVGFNVASVANNHMADKGAAAFVETIETLKNAGFEGVVGGYVNKEDIGSYTIIEKNGVRFGFLAYTYGLNSGFGEENWRVDRISTEGITKDVNALRPQCDFLAVSMHWGVEYEQLPSDSQKEFANLLASLGVDLIIGTHPHVMQPAQWIDREGGEQALCIYSLGNFVSGQREQDRLIGGMLKLELEFTPEGRFVGYKSAEIEGAVTHYEAGNENFRLIMLDDYSEELAAAHGLHKYDRPITYEFMKERMAGIKESLAR